MSDSDKTNELDNYGVWVKKPPRTVSSEIGEENTDTLSIDNDLPSFDSIDVVDDSMAGIDPDAENATLSDDELANIADSSNFEPAQESAESSGETEEISLDEFIEGGVFDGDDNSAPASSEPAPTSTSQEESSVSVDDFMESSDITVSDSPSVSDSPALSDDGPIDIDLSFDDSASMPSTGSSSASSSAPVKEVAGSEEVDLSDFGVDFGSDEGSSSSESSAPADDGTESVDLSDFGVDFSDGASSSPAAEATPEPQEPQEEVSAPVSEPVINEDGTEEISLDSFGFDINAEENKSDDGPKETASTIEAEENPSLDSSEKTLTINDNISIESDDDDVGNISLETSPSSSSEEEQDSGTQQSFESQDNDDFDLDSIMDSIEDENGNTSSLNDEPIAVSEDIIEEEPSIEGIPADEPAIDEVLVEEPVAEEPVINDVVDMDEPVFEETAVDIPESEQVTESENPFTLPPDDAFSTPIAEESVPEEITEEPVIEDTAPSIPEEEPAIVEESSVEMPAEEPVKQDEEISSAANNILNQIASELSSLRNEISNLKNEFEELKNKEPAAAAPQTEPESEVPAEQESSGGFFGSEDEDDTIALSLDEMDNILNTVEIVEEEAPTLPESSSIDITEEETPSEEGTEESLDFSNESIEEPVLDDIDTNIADDELPEEILVPKSEDDILVESSQENLIEEEPEETVSLDASDEELAIDEPVAEPESDEDVAFDIADSSEADEDATMLDEPFVFDDSEQNNEIPEDDTADATLSADELANIAADSSSTPSVSDILDDTSSDEAEEESSGISISEGELDTLLSSEAALAEQNRKQQEEEENATPVQSSIPENLQKEIKSVLSYMDQLLENLPEEKIAEFAQSEQFETYKKLFKELGLE